MESISSRIVLLSKKVAAEENPQELYQMIRPTLSTMGVANLLQNNKTEITQLTDSKGRRLFKVLFRREAEIADEEIERMRRESDNFEKIEWTSQGMVLSLWDEYTAPPEAEEAI